MITKVVMPQLSLSMREGIVTRWLKKEGEFVKAGEAICEIEADKASTEIEAPVSGYVIKIVAKEGDEFPVREVMVYLGDRGDIITEDFDEVPHKKVAQPSAHAEMSVETPGKQTGRILASPVAKRLAAEFGINLNNVKGSGPDGMIGKEDVLAAKERISTTSPAVPSHENVTIKFKSIKKIVADRMKESYLDAPHIRLTLSCDMSEALKLRKTFNEQNPNGPHLTISDLVVWACGRTLGNHPLLNAGYKDGTIVTFSHININLAMDTDQGLIAPVISNANHRSLPDVALKRLELAERVRGGSHTQEDLSGGTFTITNLGMFGIEQFDAILNPGQAGILSVGTIKPTPIAENDGGIAIRPILQLTLTCDHRIADGADGARFLVDLKAILENPDDMSEKS